MNGVDPSNKTQQSQRRRRASKACINCRKRKTKCDYDKASLQCIRCKEEDLNCVISEIENRGGYSNVLAGKEKRERELNQQSYKEEDATSPIAEDSVLQHELYNPSDAIEILHSASSHRGLKNLKRKRDERYPRSELPVDDYGGISSRRTSIHESLIVMDGIITAEEASKLVRFFFAEISPFYASYIPSEYQELARISAEPALLAVVCTIGARCLDLETFSGVHKRLWTYCKRTINDMVWECPDHQVRSLIFAVLTLAEWFPGALMLGSLPGEALRRHTRICWPLMGQALRLAKYVGLLKHDIQATIALHFADHLLACRLGQLPMLHQLGDDTDEELLSPLIERCSLHDRARLDIVKLLHIAGRALYRSRSETRKLVNSGQYLTVLELINQLVIKWKRDYREIVEGSSWIDRTTMFEFYHFELITFAIALVPWQHASATSRLLDFSNCETYLRIAIDAAVAIIEHESSLERPVELKFSPIQWITRILHASVFLAKALLLQTVFTAPEQKHRIVHLLDTAAHTLAQLPPDDQRIYSRPLERIVKRFRSPTSVSPPNNVDDNGVDSALEVLLDQEFLGHMFTEEVPGYDVFRYMSPI